MAVLAAALLVASPFTWVQTASLLGYQLSFVLGTAAAAAFVRAGNAPSPRNGLLAGVLLGLAVFHRPFDALLATAPVLVYWSWTAWRRHTLARAAAPVVIGAAPFAAVFLAYDRAVMGSVARLAYNVTGPADAFGFGWRASFEVPGGGHDGQIDYTIGRALSTLGHLFVALPRVVAFAPAVVVLVGVALWTRRRDARVWLLAAMFVVVVAGYFFWWGVSNSYHFELDRSLGPFYYYPVLAPLCVLAAWGAVLIRRTVALGAVIVVVGLAWAGIAAPSVLREARRGGDARTTEIDALRVPTPSLVLDAPLFPNDPYLRVATDATLRRRDLVAVDVPGRRLELVDRFPDRAAYLVQSYHRFGDFLGPEQRERVALRVARQRGDGARAGPARAGARRARVRADRPGRARVVERGARHLRRDDPSGPGLARATGRVDGDRGGGGGRGAGRGRADLDDRQRVRMPQRGACDGGSRRRSAAALRRSSSLPVPDRDVGDGGGGRVAGTSGDVLGGLTSVTSL